MSLVSEQVALHPLLEARWSPRAFDADHDMTAAEAESLLEAARWTPSANNSQPWRYILAHRGTPVFEQIVAALAPGNQVWAVNASVLVVALMVVGDPGSPMARWAVYDVGQSVAHLSVQAHALGYHTHQMGGFDADSLRTSFNLGEELEPLIITAVGRVADPTTLPEAYRVRETKPRERLPLADLLVG